MLIATKKLEHTESANNTCLVRVAAPGYGLKIRWRAQELDPNKYRLAPAGSHQT